MRRRNFALGFLGADKQNLAARDVMPKPIRRAARHVGASRKAMSVLPAPPSPCSVVTSPRGILLTTSQSTGGGASFGHAAGVMNVAGTIAVVSSMVAGSSRWWCRRRRRSVRFGVVSVGRLLVAGVVSFPCLDDRVVLYRRVWPWRRR